MLRTPSRTVHAMASRTWARVITVAFSIGFKYLKPQVN